MDNREEAIRIIGEDRVPADVLETLIADFGEHEPEVRYIAYPVRVWNWRELVARDEPSIVTVLVPSVGTAPLINEIGSHAGRPEHVHLRAE